MIADTLRAPPMPWTYLCLAVVALVVAQLGVSLFSALRRMRAESRQQALELARFQEDLAAARERRQKAAQDPLPWNGFRKFVVRRRAHESDTVVSLHLAPHDARPLAPFKPGQYLTFRVPGGQGAAPLTRCYSLSDRPHTGHYRVTIKRVAEGSGPTASHGLSSRLLCDNVKEGDILDLRAPSGTFCLEGPDQDSLVLIGGGIGVTPVFSMLAALAHQKSRQAIWFFYGVRDGREHLFRPELEAMAREIPNLRVRVCYSRPRPEDRAGDDYRHAGRVTVDLLRRELPSNNFRFYYCGPAAMLEDLTSGLRLWGVPESHLHFETFGALSAQRIGHATKVVAPPPGLGHKVHFRKSAMAVQWDGSHETLLDVAEQAGIAVPSGCRAGNCGTCVVALESGEVTYLHAPGSPPEARTCLMCIARPKGDVVLDA